MEPANPASDRRKLLRVVAAPVTLIKGNSAPPLLRMVAPATFATAADKG